MARICWGHSAGWFIHSFGFKWSVKKHFVAKVLPAVWEIFLHEKNCNYNFYRFSYKFASILFLSFLTNQKQESSFQQVGGLVKRNISVFCLYWVALNFKAMLNSTDLKEFSYMLFLFVLYFHVSQGENR